MRHVIVSTGAPSTAPEFTGQHYIDTVSGQVYNATGTASVANWVNITGTTVIKTVTASYTLILSDADNTVLETNVASANTLTSPPNSSVPFPIGTTIPVTNYGAGQTTVTPGAGVTIRSAGGATKLRTQYSGASFYKHGTDEWVLTGDIST